MSDTTPDHITLVLPCAAMLLAEGQDEEAQHKEGPFDDTEKLPRATPDHRPE